MLLKASFLTRKLLNRSTYSDPRVIYKHYFASKMSEIVASSLSSASHVSSESEALLKAETKAKVDEILDFWFLPKDHAEFGKTRVAWFKSDPVFDQEILDKFGPLIDAAIAGDLEDEWMKTPESGIAHITLLDQFTRNTKRNTAGAWSGDARALRNSLEIIYSFKYAKLPQIMQAMTLMPLMHAEHIEIQELSMHHFGELAKKSDHIDFHGFAKKHRDVVANFGRFPARNKFLGRETAPLEAVYQANGGGF